MHDHSTKGHDPAKGDVTRDLARGMSGIGARLRIKPERTAAGRILEDMLGGQFLRVAPLPESEGWYYLKEASSGFVPTYDEFIELFEAAEKFYDIATHDEIVEHNRRLYEERVNPTPVAAAPPPKRRPGEGYVYLLRGQGCYKIGRAKNPERRSETLGIQLPFPVELWLTIYSRDYVALESALHKRFDDRRLNGEWFDLDPEDIAYLEGLAALQSGTDALDAALGTGR